MLTDALGVIEDDLGWEFMQQRVDTFSRWQALATADAGAGEGG